MNYINKMKYINKVTMSFFGFKLPVIIGFKLAVAIVFLNIRVYSQNYTIPGKVITPFPTIINLAVEWNIQGDDNQNGIVTLQFRQEGKRKWNQGMPLRRVPAGENKTALTLPRKAPGYSGFKWENKHSGSIFDLKPNTVYEIKLTLKDPDGGSVIKLVKAHTRPAPHIGDNAKIIEIAPGNYDTLHTVSGTAEKPVVYRCSKGNATFKFIDVKNRKWVLVEKLNVKNITAGGIGIRLDGAENCVVRQCNINAVYGIVAYLPGVTNCDFSDNEISGTCVWTNEAMGAQGDNVGEGIEITGSGNVISFNKITGFRDCISFMEDEHLITQTCNDIYNNDISIALDDAIEADFSLSNCRIFRNRITNCYVGLSSQPGLGGPTYFIRNVMYNIVHAAFKLKRNSQGDVVLHNTVIKIGAGLGGNSAMDYAYFRNNLAFGGPTGGINWGGYGAGSPYAANILDPGSHSSFDYDAVGVFGTPYIAKIGERNFSEVEKHGVEQIMLENTFFNVDFPNPPIPSWGIPDLRLKPGSKAEDAAIFIPNINDNFKGKAPDCGAYEMGQPMPHYGPRTL